VFSEIPSAAREPYDYEGLLGAIVLVS
jgi:hypothetical protein